MKKHNRKFKARPGQQINNEQAERYGSYIYGLGQRRKKGVQPEELVQLASEEDNPCHDYFEWDDSAAAHEYRLNQARRLLRSFTVIIEDPETGEAVEDVGMHRVPVKGRGKAATFAYVPVEQAVQEEESLAFVLAEYVRRLRSIEKDMENCQSFASAFAEVLPVLREAIDRIDAMAAAS